MHHDPGDRPAKGKTRNHTPTGASSPLDAVRQLMSERDKFTKWLTDLDAKRDSTPVHVFDRVKADYSARLQAVLDKLKQHSAGLQEHAAGLARKLEQLSESEQGILDTRAESELRAQVGELSPLEWDKTSKKLEKDLAKIKQDQTVISDDLSNLRALLGSFGSVAPAAETTTTAPAPAASDAPLPATVTVAPAAGNVDELAFLKSVIGTTPTPPQPAPVSAAPEAPAPPKAPARPAVEKVVETPPPGPVIKSRPGEEPLAMHVTGSNPIVLRSSGVVEQPKTLKCGECGSMNYPSEWYCERCGAELTSV